MKIASILLLILAPAFLSAQTQKVYRFKTKWENIQQDKYGTILFAPECVTLTEWNDELQSGEVYIWLLLEMGDNYAMDCDDLKKAKELPPKKIREGLFEIHAVKCMEGEFTKTRKN